MADDKSASPQGGYNAADWSAFMPEIQRAILQYAGQFDGFKAEHFLEVYSHLARGSVTKSHTDYVTRLYEELTGGGTFPPKDPSDISREVTADDVASIYESTIKEDRETKLILFYGALNNYTDEGQVNIGFEAVSSSGKSYIAVEILSLFPEEDVDKLLYASPKSFFHRFGELVHEDGETPLPLRSEFMASGLQKWEGEHPQPEKGAAGSKQWRDDRKAETSRLRNEWDKIPKGIRVDLEKRILVFLDQPHYTLLETLRPILSHDEKKTVAQFADKDAAGALYAKQVFIIGYPTSVHLTARTGAEEQEKTRMFVLSPSCSQKKLEGSIDLLADRPRDPDSFKRRVKNESPRLTLAARIRMLKEAEITDVVVTETDMQYLKGRFKEEHPRLRPRHQRDFPRLKALISGPALLNFTNRQRKGRSIIANMSDIATGYGLYKSISAPSECGLSPGLYSFWTDSLKPALESAIKSEVIGFGDKRLKEETEAGIRRADFRSLWWRHFGSHLTEYSLKETLEVFEAADLIEMRANTEDGRTKMIYLRGHSVEKYPPSKTKAKTEDNAENKTDPKPNEEGHHQEPPPKPEESEAPDYDPNDEGAFQIWLSKLPLKGTRGFREDVVKKAHGHTDKLSEFAKRGWLEQRGGTSTWWISDAGQTALKRTSHGTRTKDSPPQPVLHRGWCERVLGIFDRDLANNGQDRHLDDIKAEFAGHEREVSEAIFTLIQEHRLEEVSPGNFRRVV